MFALYCGLTLKRRYWRNCPLSETRVENQQAFPSAAVAVRRQAQQTRSRTGANGRATARRGFG
jgi:hypothetical protein